MTGCAPVAFGRIETEETALRQHVMTRRRILSGVAIVAAVAIGTVVFLKNPGRRYRLLGVPDGFYEAVRTRLANGETLNQVVAVIGPPTSTPAQEARILAAQRKMFAERPHEYPDGFEPTDRFVGWDVGGIGNYFHFRDGHLVNFDPAIYGRPPDLSGLSP